MCFQGCYLVMCSVFTFMLEVLNMCMFSFPIKSQESTRSMCSDQPMQPSVPRLNYSWVWQRDMVLTDLAPLGSVYIEARRATAGASSTSSGIARCDLQSRCWTLL